MSIVRKIYATARSEGDEGEITTRVRFSGVEFKIGVENGEVIASNYIGSYLSDYEATIATAGTFINQPTFSSPRNFPPGSIFGKKTPLFHSYLPGMFKPCRRMCIRERIDQ